MNLYRKLRNIAPHGFWMFLNNRNKKVYISYNVDILGAMAKHVRMLNRREHPIKLMNKHRKSFRFVVLDNVYLDDMNARIQLNYWIDKYEKMGYKSYRGKPLIKFSVGYDVYGDKIGVFLKTARNQRIIVGMFKNMFDATEFIETYYNSDNIIFPVYANNEHTKRYILSNEE